MPTSPSDKREREPTEVLYRGCMTVGGAIFALLCAALTIWAIWLLITGGFSVLNLLIALFFGAFAIFGAWMSWAGFRRTTSAQPSRRMLEGSRERTVLRIAKKLGGRLTVGELTLHTSLEPGEAQNILDQLEMQRIAELQISDAGREVYVFPTFLDEGRDKQSAHSLLDEDREVELLFEELEELEEREPEEVPARRSSGRDTSADED